MTNQTQYFDWKDYNFRMLAPDDDFDKIASDKAALYRDKKKTVKYATGKNGNRNDAKILSTNGKPENI